MKEYSLKEFEKFVEENSEEKYRDFHSTLIRTNYTVNGIRIPILRKYAKEIVKSRDVSAFLAEKPKCYEGCMLKGIMLSYVKADNNKFFAMLEDFLDDADDWSLIDVGCCGIHRKDSAYLSKILQYASSERIWYARWGIVAVLVNFTDRQDVVLQVVDNLIAKHYYVDMALAWLIQVLAVKNRDVAISLMQSDKVSREVKKMALRKIKDSFRISQEEKQYFTQIIEG